MYLKQLELIGFKSFAERTRMDFGPGITAIVGPNGGGKTNIVDSIKWALGEQSAKSLRSTRMEEVIFHGTDDRKGIGMAEVSVTFDNSKKCLPLEFSEVTVTRRVFRSGEGQYFINKNLCRLKDIDDIFMDTGIGMSAYSVFEQGRMDLILSSRPDERRFIFEEAAGITKYKEHKREALHKLEVTENNLVRLNDIIKEIQRQLNSIERAAAKARRYKRLSEELHTQEVKLLVYQLRELKGKSLESEKDKLLIEEQVARLRETINGKESGLGELRQNLRQLETEISLIQDERLEIETKLVSYRHQIQYNQNKIQETEERGHAIDAELVQLNSELTSLNGALSDLTKGILEAQDVRNSYKNILDEKSGLIKSLDLKIEELSNGVALKKEFLVGKTASESHIKNELSRLDLGFRDLSLKSRRDSVEFTKKKKQKDEMAQELTKAESVLSTQKKALLSMRQRIKDNEEKIILLKDEVASINKTLKDKQLWFSEKRSEYEILSSQKKDLEGYTDGVKVIMENKDEFPGIIGSTDDLVSVQGKYAVAIGSVIGTGIQWIVIDTISNACQVIKKMHDRDANLVRDEVSNGANRTVFLVAVDPAGIASGGKITDSISGLICRDKVIDELKVVLNNLSDEILALTEKYNLSEERLLQEESQLEIAKNNLYNEEIALSVQENDFLKAKTAYDSLCEEIEVLEMDKEEIESGRQELTAQKTKMEDGLALIGEELKSIYSEIGKSQEILKETEAGRQKEEREYTELKISLVSAEEKENLAEFKNNQMQGQIETLNSAINRLSSEKSENMGLAQRLQEEISRLTMDVSEFSGKSRDIVEKYEAIKLKTKELEQAVSHQEETLRRERQSADGVYASLNERQLGLSQTRLQIDNIMQRLQNEYKIAPDSIDSVSLEGISMDILEQEIITLRDKLDAMGEVSLVAIEEQDSLVKRYEFLTTQREDLVNAKESLLKAIAKLNTTTKKLFWDAFCQIRENFAKIFCELFGGGKADLVLIDESDILESGIEIIARPPGKRLQNVSLLSGGEKALTAIALLFSIFKIRPSPFCIMDEIDAPLDDSNIERFVELLKEFAKTSQFMIVTHNKRTISAADTLYGITMQESGISKVVSVRFAAAGVPSG